MAGFTSVGSFTTRFGRTFGLSPTVYRSAFPPAAARARIPDCLLRAWGRPHQQTARLEKTSRGGPP
jgi:AraC-like DNA-binding protein